MKAGVRRQRGLLRESGFLLATLAAGGLMIGFLLVIVGRHDAELARIGEAAAALRDDPVRSVELAERHRAADRELKRDIFGLFAATFGVFLAAQSLLVVRARRRLAIQQGDRERQRRALEHEVAERAARLAVESASRREVEGELARQRDWLALALGSAHMLAWRWEAGPGTLEASQDCATFFGVPGPARPMNRDGLLACIHAADRQRVASFLDDARCRPGELRRVEFRGGAGERWFETHGRASPGAGGQGVAVVGITLDVTERKAAETALLDSHVRLRTILDHAIDAVIVIDEQGRIETFNRAAERLFGYPSAAVVGRDVGLLMPREHAAAHGAYLARYLSGAPSRVVGQGREVEARHRDGRPIPVDIAVSEARVGERRVFTALLRDVSERRAFEADLVRTKEAAEEANRAKSRFLSSMSHELRTPLNAVLGFAQLIEGEDGADDAIRKSAAEIRRGGHHLLTLINEVLDLSRIESGRLELRIEDIDLAELCAECAALAEPIAAKHRTPIMVAGGPATAGVRADRTRLKEILLNLLSNAIKYNRPGGDVLICWRAGEEGRVRIGVRDTGEGIGPAQQAHLFEPFNRLGRESSRVEGTGIGLVIVKRLVEVMGGAIALDSALGVGSTFWVNLPACAPPAAAPPASVPAVLPRPGGARTILHIEDNPSNLRLVEALVRQRTPHRLVGAMDPAHGLKQARTLHPDLILLDINLPGMNGYEVLAKVRDDPELHDIPVVAVTANAMLGDAERGRAAGFADYLTKPLDIERFVAVVQTQIERNHAPACRNA